MQNFSAAFYAIYYSKNYIATRFLVFDNRT